MAAGLHEEQFAGEACSPPADYNETVFAGLKRFVCVHGLESAGCSSSDDTVVWNDLGINKEKKGFGGSVHCS